MMVKILSSPSQAEFLPLSPAEQHRLRSLFESVSTRTLLLSLLKLTRGIQDTDLIIGALLDRLSLDDIIIEPQPGSLPPCP